MPGLLVLNGGDEFHPGNEPQDRMLVAAAGPGPALVLPTAGARQHPERAVSNAVGWFAPLGLDLEELPVLRRTDAGSPALASRAAASGLLYLVGGDPGHVVKVLMGTPVWASMVSAWRSGAALAGSSAGAMALCQWTLVMARWPRHDVRRAAPALGLLPGVAFLPHYETFGHRWAEGEIVDSPSGAVLLGVDERTAAVWDTGGWQAQGAGSVTVISPSGQRRAYAAGEKVRGLPAPG